VPERAPIRQPQRGSPDHRGMENRLEYQPAAHELLRAHADRICSPPQKGPNPERTLLINDGKLGSRSAALLPPSIALPDLYRYFNNIRVRSFVLNGAPFSTYLRTRSCGSQMASTFRQAVRKNATLRSVCPSTSARKSSRCGSKTARNRNGTTTRLRKKRAVVARRPGAKA
jgi:hypothetical protein